ncbi:MAG: hypothetical protein GF341_08600 [candidate division Zixibacteria bacterium]|nr:hypothetical protein [candidate division Zixibacteria bacterium]
MSLKRLVALCAVFALAAIGVYGLTHAEQPDDTMTPAPDPFSDGDFCGTQEIWEQRYPGAMETTGRACPINGQCDVAATRDASVPAPGAGPLIFRLKFNVFREDDGSNRAAGPNVIELQMDHLRADFAPYGIDFVHEIEYIDDTDYRYLEFSEEFGMKTTYADTPDSQCNVYVVEAPVNWGTFPWDPNATLAMGGVVMHEGSFGFEQSTLTHELGHNFGLWHTHHGVDEVTPCGVCYELPDGSNGDVAGDFCSDTRPTPTNNSCSPPLATDDCTGDPWLDPPTDNYMDYSGDFCWTEFTTQQWGRIYCWVAQELIGWVQLEFSADLDTAEGSLTTNLSYDTPLTASAWKWYFGDGDSSMVENPTHTFGPGLYDVRLEATTTGGTMTRTKNSFIAVWADTFTATETSVQANSPGVVEIYGTNAVPLEEVVLPITMTNVLDKFFLDSISFAGTRLGYFESREIVFNNKFSGQLAVRARADAGGGSPPLEPGSGLMARVYFRSKINSVPGDTSYVSVGQLGSYTIESTTLSTSFAPVFNGATIRVANPPCACPWQADFDENGLLDAVDLNNEINALFFSGSNPQDPACPTTRADVNNDNTPDAVDLNLLIDHIFFNGDAPCDPCDPVSGSCGS